MPAQTTDAIVKEINNQLARIEKSSAHFKETSSQRWMRSLAPFILIVVVWVSGAILLVKTQNSWGKIENGKWETVVLRSVVLVAAFGSLTAVSIAAMRRDW